MKNTFYVFGTGPSINNITDEEWEYLKEKHTISMSTFPLTGKRLENYYSHERIALDSYMLRILKRNNYIDTNLFISHNQSIVLAIKLGFKSIQPIIKGSALFLPKRLPWYIDESTPPCSFLEYRAK